MRILLVSPRTPDTFWSFRHAVRFVHKRSTLPPLGLLTLAAMLPREWELEMVDLDVDRLKDEQIRAADWVMIGAMLVHLASVREVAARRRDLGKPVIGGGPLFTEDEPAPEGIDHVVLGEAEELIGDLVADMKAGKVKPCYRGDHFPDVTRTPMPRWDLTAGAGMTSAVIAG